MRLTTWNCQHGTIEDRLAQLQPLAPDLVALQECRRPAFASPNAIWSGTLDPKGIAVASINPSLRLERLEVTVAPTALPVLVHGPEPFVLLAVWTLPPYEKFAIEAVRACAAVGVSRDLPMLVMGDLNVIPTRERLRMFREEFGLVSAYHAFHKVDPGAEAHPTHYWKRKQSSPWHIDYCFVPEGWVPKLRDVQVGGFDEWPDSDHRPLTIESTY